MTEIIVNLSSEAKVASISVGVVTLFFASKTLVSPKCLHVSAVTHNLTSVSARLYFPNGTEVIVKRNGSFICFGGIPNLHLLTPSLYEIHDTEIINTPQTLPLKREFSSTNPTKFLALVALEARA